MKCSRGTMDSFVRMTSLALVCAVLAGCGGSKRTGRVSPRAATVTPVQEADAAEFERLFVDLEMVPQEEVQ